MLNRFAHRPHPKRLLKRSVLVRNSRGFTFVEVLFAIIILGIGMIMLAAMLPVAINQTALTRDVITGKASTEAGYAYIRATVQANPTAFPPTNDNSQLVIDSDPAVDVLRDFLTGSGPYTYDDSGSATGPAGRVVPLTFNVADRANPPAATYPNAKASLQALVGSRIDSSDPAVQWIPFYRRDVGSNIVKFTLLSTRLRNTESASGYGAATLKNESIGSGNGPFLVQVEIEDRLTEPDVIKFVESGTGTIDQRVAASGAYVIIAHSPPPNATDDLNRPFRNNGRVFRLANRRDDLDSAAGGARVWELDPSNDLASAKVGDDGVLNSPDDVPDGSMNTADSFEDIPARELPNHTFSGFAGTKTWAWIIGKGLLAPTAPESLGNQYQGLAQDINVLQFDITLPE
jgi:prepilin-type N-terminal cleavage/methylation domain-containing protein